MSEHEHESPRFSAVEYRDHSAHARLDSLERSVGQLADSVAGFAEKTERHLLALTDRVSESKQTDWPVLIAAGALVLSLVGGGWFLVTSQTDGLASVLGERDFAHAQAIQTLDERLDRHALLPGHSDAMQRHERINARLEEVFRRLDDLQAEQKQADAERADMRDELGDRTRDRFTLRDYLEHEGGQQ